MQSSKALKLLKRKNEQASESSKITKCWKQSYNTYNLKKSWNIYFEKANFEFDKYNLVGKISFEINYELFIKI